MVWLAATGYGIMANELSWLGAEPRLAPERRTTSPSETGVSQAAERPLPHDGRA